MAATDFSGSSRGNSRARRRAARGVRLQKSALHCLTLAAIALPGLAPTQCCAADADEFDLQYGHYQEGERDLGGVKSKFRPVESNSLHNRLQLRLNDRWQGTLNYLQDVWSGATPIATAPLVAEGNQSSAADGITGASPYLYRQLQLDDQLRPLRRGADYSVMGPDTRLAHTMAGASPEVRRQVDATFSRALEAATLDLGGGVSREPDYKSNFANAAGHWALDQQRLTLNASTSYTRSVTDALIDHDSYVYVYGYYDQKGNPIYNERHRSSQIAPAGGTVVVHGARNEWNAQLGAVRVFNRGALLELSLGYGRGTGYLGNPYKAVEIAFIDPAQQFGTAGGNPAADYAYDAQFVAVPEERPDERSQQTLSLRYVQYFVASDGALHVDYRYFRDNWGIRSHTLSTEWIQPLGRGWSIAPRLRYYSQTAADFYTPYVVSHQGLYTNVTDPVLGQIYVNSSSPNDGHSYYEDPTLTVPPPIDNDPASWNYGNPIVGYSNGGAIIDRTSGKPVTNQLLVDSLMADTAIYDPAKLPAHYSSDPRLSAFGTLSAALTLTHKFDNGLSLEISCEHFRHAGSLKLGGGGEGSFADYGGYLANVVLKGSLGATGDHPGGGRDHSGASHAPAAPAGLMQAHMLERPGAWMVGYRFQRDTRGGALMHSRQPAGDAQVVAGGCLPDSCYVRPAAMAMNMHMLDIMYAYSERLNLMLVPQFVDNRMSMRPLDGAPPAGGMGSPVGAAVMHAGHPHTSGGVGDTELHALFRLNGPGDHQAILGLGLSAPTGNVGLKLRDVMQTDMGYMDYGMQTGSGTWDFKGSLSYRGGSSRLQWGAQLAGTQRLQRGNASSYALGNALQATAWTSIAVHGGLSASLRVLHSQQGAIRGAFNGTFIPISTTDYATNYGGRFWDAGLGVALALPALGSMHDHLAVEWLQPVKDEARGYQLERNGSLTCSLSLTF